MGFEQAILDHLIVPGALEFLGVEEPVAIELLGCVDLEKLKAVLRKHGLTELAGIDLSDVLDAVEKDEPKGKP
jgi:hypothetical protein